MNLLQFFYPSNTDAGDEHHRHQQADAEDELLAAFDPDEFSNPPLHARNCEKRNFYMVKTFRRVNGEVKLLKGMTADNRRTTTLIGIIILASVWLKPGADELFLRFARAWLGID